MSENRATKVRERKPETTSSAMAAYQALLCSNRSFLPTKPIFHRPKNLTTRFSLLHDKTLLPKSLKTPKLNLEFRFSTDKLICHATPQKPSAAMEELDDNLRKVIQALLWVAEGVYILWLFLLPYAPVSKCPFPCVFSWVFSSLT